MAKKFGRLLKCNSRVLSKTLRKIIKVIFTIIISFGTFNDFFLILAKKLNRCVETVIWLYGGKNDKKSCWTIGFWSFLDFEKEKPVFSQESFWQGCQKYLDVSSGTLTEQIFRTEVLKTRGFSKIFWSFRDKDGKTFPGLAKQQ